MELSKMEPSKMEPSKMALGSVSTLEVSARLEVEVSAQLVVVRPPLSEMKENGGKRRVLVQF